MNWPSAASDAGLHRSNGSIVPGHDEVLPSTVVQPAAFSGGGFFSDMNFTNRSGHEAAVASRLGVAGEQAFGVTTHDAASSSSGSSNLSRSQSQSLGTARPVSGGPTDMDMDMDLEEEHDSSDHRAPTKLSIHAPASTKLVAAASSPYQEGFVGGFGTAGLKSVVHPTSPRSPVGAWSNACGDRGVATSRLSGLPARTNTTQGLQAPAASAAPAAGEERRRKQCEDCGSAIGRWGAVKKADRSLGGKPCGSCGGYVAGERESESTGRHQDWSETSTSTAFTSPSATERANDRGKNKDHGKGSTGKGSSKGQINERRKMPWRAKAIPFPANEDGDNRGNHSDHGGLVHGATWASQEAQLPSVDEDERQARRTKHKRGREEEDSEPAAPPSSTDSRLVGRRRGNDLIAPMPQLSWGQSGHHSPTHTSRRASSGSVGGGAGAGGGGGGGAGAGGRGRDEGGMTATSVETRSDPPSDRVSKRRKSDQSHGDSSPLKSSVMVAARSKYRIVQHRGFSDSGEVVGGRTDSIDKRPLDGATDKGASGQTTYASGQTAYSPGQSMYSPGQSMYSPGISSSSINSSNRRHDNRSSDMNSSSSGSYRRRYRDEYSKNSSRRRQGLVPSPLYKGSPEATGRCAAPRTPTAAAAVSSVDPSIPLLVVIDGSNVAFSFRQDVSNPRWSPQGILLAVKFFQERDVPVVAFVPRPRVDSIAPGTEHYDAFMEAMRSQAISTVPSKANDDLFILLYAIQRSAHIVTNDQFRDHLGNASTLDSLGLTKDELRTFLRDHHVSYTFARDEFVANPEAAIVRMLTKQTAGVGSEVRRRGAT